MTDYNELKKIYKQNLSESIISILAKKKNLPYDKAMSIYYKSQLAKQVSEGSFGIENLDAKYLVNDLIDNEPELF